MAKIPLIMTDGTPVRTIEELREHFDINKILEYFTNGQLLKWLFDRYYDKEADQIEKLNTQQDNLAFKICEILGVSIDKSQDSQVSIEDIIDRNKRLEKLKKYTADDYLLDQVDYVAFSQEDVMRLLQKGVSKIYLCGEKFDLPGNIGEIEYIGINSPVIDFNGVIAPGIACHGVGFIIDKYLDPVNRSDNFYAAYGNNQPVGVKFLERSIEEGNSTAKAVLGECYIEGFGVEKCESKGKELVIEAANEGAPYAQYLCGEWNFKEYVSRKKDYSKSKKTLENFISSTKTGDFKGKAIYWLEKAALNGNLAAKIRIGFLYEKYYSIKTMTEKNSSYIPPECKESSNRIDRSIGCYKEAALKGNVEAEYNLGRILVETAEKSGINEIDEKQKKLEEAEKWLTSALEKGCIEAETLLIPLNPRKFEISKVIIAAMDGVDNIIADESVISVNSKETVFRIRIKGPGRIKDDILEKYGTEGIKDDEIDIDDLFDHWKETKAVCILYKSFGNNLVMFKLNEVVDVAPLKKRLKDVVLKMSKEDEVE